MKSKLFIAIVGTMVLVLGGSLAGFSGQTNDVIKQYYDLSHQVAPDLPTMMNLCTGVEQFKPLVGSLDIWGPMPHSYFGDIDFFQQRKQAGDKSGWIGNGFS